jgi:hypothetical protein
LEGKTFCLLDTIEAADTLTKRNPETPSTTGTTRWSDSLCKKVPSQILSISTDFLCFVINGLASEGISKKVEERRRCVC